MSVSVCANMQILQLLSRTGIKTASRVYNLRPTNAILKVERRHESTKSWKDIPGPSSLPIIGPLLHFMPIGPLGTEMGQAAFDKMYKAYGPIVKLDAMVDKPAMVLLFDAEACSQVLRSESVYPMRPGFESLEYFRKVYSKPTSDFTGLLSDHGETWKSFRSKVNPVMLQPRTVKMYSTVLDEVALDMVKRLRFLRDDKNMIPNSLDTELNRWALESIGVVALGGRIGCLEPDLPEDSPAKQLINVVHDIFEIAQELDFKPSLWRWITTRKFKKAMLLYQKQVDLSEIFINNARKELHKNKNSTNEKSILEKLLEIDEHVAAIMAADMLFAGVDTAANTLLATMYLLAKNPEKQSKLREELTKNEDQKYLKACLKESMRMMPVTAGNMRRSTKEYNLLGYNIPKDSNIVFCHQYLSMMEEQYPRPQEYIPERWLVSNDDLIYHGRAHPFATLTFGFGARQCIGKRIANLEMEVMITRLIQNFTLEWVGDPIKIRPSTLNYVDGPYNYKFIDL